MIAPLNDDALKASENEGLSLCFQVAGKCISGDSLRTEDAPRTVMGEGHVLTSSVISPAEYSCTGSGLHPASFSFGNGIPQLETTSAWAGSLHIVKVCEVDLAEKAMPGVPAARKVKEVAVAPDEIKLPLNQPPSFQTQWSSRAACQRSRQKVGSSPSLTTVLCS